MENHNNAFTFTELEAEDLPKLFSWLTQPYIARWWPEPRQWLEFEQKFLNKIESPDIFPFLIVMNGLPIGYLQYYLLTPHYRTWLPELPEKTIDIDLFIGQLEHIGKGYGPVILKAFIDYACKTRKMPIETLIVNPDPANAAAIRCNEKAGFIPVGIISTKNAPEGIFAQQEKEVFLMRYDVEKSGSQEQIQPLVSLAKVYDVQNLAKIDKNIG